jgi:heat shock protein HslJ
MKRKNFLFLVNILLGATMLLTACSASPNTKPALPLDKTKWVLQSYGQPENLKSALTSVGTMKDIEITAVFDKAKGQVTGSSGLNTYGGSYQLDGNKLSVSNVTRTLIGGPQPLMDQENEFFPLLAAAQSFQISDSRLQINCGQQVLIFTAK